jgi:hypothetical protein
LDRQGQHVALGPRAVVGVGGAQGAVPRQRRADRSGQGGVVRGLKRAASSFLVRPEKGPVLFRWRDCPDLNVVTAAARR